MNSQVPRWRYGDNHVHIRIRELGSLTNRSAQSPGSQREGGMQSVPALVEKQEEREGERVRGRKEHPRRRDPFSPGRALIESRSFN